MEPMPAAATPTDPETIRRTAEEVLRRPAYQLDPPSDAGATLLDWLLRILRWIWTPFQWLIDALGDLPFVLALPIVSGLVALLVLLVFHVGYTIVKAVGGPSQRRGPAAAVLRTRRDPAALERQAAEAVSRGDLITAVRLLFAACLLRLEAAEKRVFRPGTTNREYLRRHRDSPVYEPLKLLVDTIETRWYGQGGCGPEDFEACRTAHCRIRDYAQEPRHAQRA
jgi:Domain of unknown function (DUF4129)